MKGTTFKNAEGTIDFNMTNDYMFRVVLQEQEKVLKGLISSMLHIPPEKIVSAQIMNPIEIGQSIEEKTFVLDIKVMLDGNTEVNLEMQVVDQGNWTNRSLSYLCRSFDNLQKSQYYGSVISVLHIGFLGFDIFEEAPEFYASYRMMNEKSHKDFNDKFELKVLSLNRADMATEDDRKWEIDRWAKLFKATKWEELRMIAQDNEAMTAAVDSLFMHNNKQNIRDLCRARQRSLSLGSD